VIRVMTRTIRGPTRKRKTYQILSHRWFHPSPSRCPCIGTLSSRRRRITSRNAVTRRPPVFPDVPSRRLIFTNASNRAGGAELGGRGAEQAAQGWAAVDQSRCVEQRGWAMFIASVGCWSGVYPANMPCRAGPSLAGLVPLGAWPGTTWNKNGSCCCHTQF
jgi:hypothetical protein